MSPTADAPVVSPAPVFARRHKHPFGDMPPDATSFHTSFSPTDTHRVYLETNWSVERGTTGIHNSLDNTEKDLFDLALDPSQRLILAENQEDPPPSVQMGSTMSKQSTTPAYIIRSVPTLPLPLTIFGSIFDWPPASWRPRPPIAAPILTCPLSHRARGAPPPCPCRTPCGPPPTTQVFSFTRTPVSVACTIWTRVWFSDTRNAGGSLTVRAGNRYNADHDLTTNRKCDCCVKGKKTCGPITNPQLFPSDQCRVPRLRGVGGARGGRRRRPTDPPCIYIINTTWTRERCQECAARRRQILCPGETHGRPPPHPQSLVVRYGCGVALRRPTYS